MASDFADLAARVEALEAMLKDLPLSALPLGPLQRKLENDWQPDASVLTSALPQFEAHTVAGAWPTAAAGATSGTPFTITRGGTVGFVCFASAFNSASTALTIDIYIDGVATGSSIKAYTNEINSHKAMVPACFTRDLSPGTHYLYYRQTAGSSDTNDAGAFMVMA